MKTKSIRKTILVGIFVLATAFSFTGCAKQKDIDKAVKPVSDKVTEMDGYVEELEAAVENLQVQAEENKNRIEELENRINCLEGKHEFVDCEYNDNDTHTGTCVHCEKVLTSDCDYGDWVNNDDGTKSKTCATCSHTVVEKVPVTIALKDGAQLTQYWEDDLTIDLSTLIDITEGAGEATYTLNSSSGALEGSILSCPLVSDYAITVAVSETATHTAATFDFTVSIKSNPATGGFDGEWVTI